MKSGMQEILENKAVTEELKTLAPVRAVWGNIDDHKTRSEWPEYDIFERDGVKVLIIHIAGSPTKYNEQVRQLIQEHHPKILVCGHSHILKVQAVKEYNNLLHMNPGAAGVHGFHKVKTILRFEINGGKIENLEVVELGRRGKTVV